MRVDCPLCREPGGELVWQDDALRVVLADEPDFPGFTRVVWQAHVAEMTDLPPDGRARLLDAVLAVEAAMREALRPDKINLASLGNVVPHLHWHVVPRFADDARFPGSPWTPREAVAGRGARTDTAGAAAGSDLAGAQTAGAGAGAGAGAARLNASRRAAARAHATRAAMPAYRAALAKRLDGLGVPDRPTR